MRRDPISGSFIGLGDQYLELVRTTQISYSEQQMRYEMIADIYAANEAIRERLLAVLGEIRGDAASLRDDGEAWSVADIVEHLSIVEAGTLRICTKLVGLAKESGKAGDGRVDLSDDFKTKASSAGDVKVEAPERVRPTGEQSLEDSITKLKQCRTMFDALCDDLERYDLSEHRFPHPFFGELTAAEWMIVLGGHEARHTGQIERMMAQRSN